MPTVVDTHVHIYACYDLHTFFKTAVENLNALGGADHTKVLCLTERHDCHVFRSLRDTGSDGLRISAVPEPEALLVEQEGGQNLYLVAGRQIVTKERLEILALTTDADIPDGLPAFDVVKQVTQLGGVPVIAWAPGKWFFKRGRVVRELIETYQTGQLLLGDSTLRPTLWPEPRLMRCGRQKGLQIVAGSDPLPFAGEETVVGTYGMVWPCDIDTNTPVSDLRNLLVGAEAGKRVGRRGSVMDMLRRMKRNRESKKGDARK